MNTHEKLLQDLGLSEKESAVYLALLKEGVASVSLIAERSGMKRPTVYTVVESLLKKHLITSAGGAVQHYVAERPQKILSLQREKVFHFERALPELLALQHQRKKRSTVRMFTGKEGIRSVYEESLLLAQGSEILSLGNAEAVESHLPGFGEWYIRRRVAGKIRMRAIITETPYHRELIKRDKQELRKTLLIQEELFTQEQEINLYGNTVAIMSFTAGEFVGTLIENEAFASGYRQMFELLWKTSSK